MRVTMVKKILRDGTPCRKCTEAEKKIESIGLLSSIDEFLLIREDSPDEGRGASLAKAHGVERAPFFVVEKEGVQTVYLSVMQVIRKVLQPAGKSPRTLGVESAAESMKNAHPEASIRWALETFGANCAIAFSGAEDVILIHMAAATGLPFSVFCLDTGRLHTETLEFMERIRTHYSLDLEVFYPDTEAVENLVRTKGLTSFYEDGHTECCGIRKVAPLKRALKTRKAWITGQRADQNPATRGTLPVVEEDPAFQGADSVLVKINPLVHWNSAQVWDFLRENDVPTNPLHENGFRSIGCAPCTRPVRTDQHEREGRWWWEEANQKECGLHGAEK